MTPVVYVVGHYREEVMKNWGIVVWLNSVSVVAAALGLERLFVCLFVVGCVGCVLPEAKTFLLLNSLFEQRIKMFVAK